MTPAPARFAADLARLTGPGERIGVAVSGGSDSLALLLLAHAACPKRIAAATVDHGFRPEAADEARFVAGLCATLGVRHAILDAVETVPLGGLRSRHEQARAIRYTLLDHWADMEGLARIATAHHADDQAETFLMRANRGAGVGGLGAIRAVNGRIVRPLLGWRRAELAAVVAGAGIVAVDDPSNRDPRYDRAAFRALLAREPRLDPARLAAAAAHCAEAEAALGWSATREWEQRASISGAEVRLDPAGLPREIARRLLLRALAQVQAAAALPLLARTDRVDALLAQLEQGGTSTLGGVLARGGATWRFCPAPARRMR